MSQKAKNALYECDTIVGYKTYINLIGELADGKEIIASCMTQEVKRAELAVNEALSGKNVCVISSGDPGVYGMTGVILESVNKADFKKIEIEVIPGIMAASSCASLLGAPLMHDFAVISLSDLLTDLKLIEKRIELAAKGDFVIVFYNPKSKKRVEPLKRAWEILMEHKSSDTPVGIVKNAMRDNEKVIIITLKDILLQKDIDMNTTIIVGNSNTYVKDKYMITPRGYIFGCN